jgi:pyruvate,water dikinase
MASGHDRQEAERSPVLRHAFQGLQSLLGDNSRLLEIMADLEADLRFLPVGTASLEAHVESLIEGTLLLIEDLNHLAQNRFRALYAAHRRIAHEVRAELALHRAPPGQTWLLPLAEVGSGRLAETGAKAARLGDLRRLLPDHTLDGFVVLASAYHAWMSGPSLSREIRALLDGIEVASDRDRVRAQTRRSREIVRAAPLHPGIASALREEAELRRSRVPSWAVRSSAVGEDGDLSFAGQFESCLNVPTEGLPDAYKQVVASRFSERAVTYRLVAGLVDAQTPMAVLVLPFVAARSAGVLYTRDPAAPGTEQMVVSSTWGLASDLVGGEAKADVFRLERQSPHRLVASALADKPTRLVAGSPSGLRAWPNRTTERDAPSLTSAELAKLCDLGLQIEAHFGSAQDIEWAIDHEGKLWVLQSRPLRLLAATEEAAATDRKPALSGGLTIFPGRAVAPALVVGAGESLGRVGEGVILVVPQATPELGSVIPFLAGLIAERGHPTSHAATLLREFAVPSLFEVPGAGQKISSGAMTGLDASGRQIYLGDPWSGVRERTLARLRRPRPAGHTSALHDTVLTLNLVDPMARRFSPEGCRSLHDLVRFVHEKAVATFFEVGDREARGRLGSSRRLETPVPMDVRVLDIGGALATTATDTKKRVRPEEIRSIPFQALWRGMGHPKVRWTGKRAISVRGFASVLASSLGGELGSMRQLGDANYLLVAPDYLNLNIRLAYHYAMVDAVVGPALENNYVNFRFRGGGAAQERRDLRAGFLTEVLGRSRFATDRRRDLVTAWLRRYPQASSEEALELLGKLMVCAGQLDMLMDNESSLRHFVERFVAGDYEAFG